MKQVTENAINAFIANRPFKSANTVVEIEGDYTFLYLFGNLIAQYSKSQNELRITNAGWQSNTTKERLNGLPGVSINQKKGVWYLNGKEWSGEWSIVKSNGQWEQKG